MSFADKAWNGGAGGFGDKSSQASTRVRVCDLSLRFKISMTENSEASIVLFVDMLGFSALIEQQGDEVNELSPIFNSMELYDPILSESLLGDRFANFHQCINSARERLQTMGNGTGVVFSDSAFFRMDDLAGAVRLARSLMFELVSSEVPARMGLARGSYRTLRFVTDSSEQVVFHMSQFLGTGIVRAHKAEKCGLAGLRILVHPDVDDLLDKESLRIVPITPVEGMSLGVRSEVNYLESNSAHLGSDFDDVIQFDCLRAMAGDAGEHFQYHYVETFKAWNLMREQLGRMPYPWERFIDRDAYDAAHGIRPGGS